MLRYIETYLYKYGYLIGSCFGKCGRGKSNASAARVVYGVVAFKEAKAIDEIEPRTRVVTKVPNDEIDITGTAAQ